MCAGGTGAWRHLTCSAGRAAEEKTNAVLLVVQVRRRLIRGVRFVRLLTYVSSSILLSECGSVGSLIIDT